MGIWKPGDPDSGYKVNDHRKAGPHGTGDDFIDWETYRKGSYPAEWDPDRFFRFDSTAGWVPVVAGPENLAASLRANPRWTIDHENLARTLADGDAWGQAAAEYEKMAAVDSLSVEFAYNAAVCFEAMGDSTQAAQWYARAASRPGADADVRANASRFQAHRPREVARGR